MQSTVGVTRSRSSLQRQYEIERELADRLRAAPQCRRLGMYGEVYNELFRRVPDHPQNLRKTDPSRQQQQTAWQLHLLSPFLNPDTVFLEVGAGDGHLTMAVAARVRHAYAVDVSDVISTASGRPSNLSLVLSDGVSIPVPPGSVNVAYSNSLIEHLHPEDAADQLRNILTALAPGGVYICRTPHRFAGPQDISRFFDSEPRGFHLKEYTYAELRRLFRQTGFAGTSTRLRFRGAGIGVADRVFLPMEGSLGLLPRAVRGWIARRRVFRPLFDAVTIVGRKGDK
jgi:SAM-dependent methyltransferase